MEAEARRHLLEHFRLLSLSTRIDPSPRAEAGELLRGLLDDKMKETLERAFRLLQIVHPREDIKSAYLALRAADKRLRAQAMEFLDTLTLPTKRASLVQRELREALRVVADDLGGADRVARVGHLLPAAPASEEEALALLLADPDEALATIAGYYALALGSPRLAEEVARACAARPILMIATAESRPSRAAPAPQEVILGGA
jgi:AAA family ATP:ADP antiporter